MNKALALNNSAIQCLKDGDAFEACDLLTEASGICLHLTEGPGSQRRLYHREHIISWINFSRSDCDERKGDGADAYDLCLYHYAAAIRKTCCSTNPSLHRGSCNQFCHQCMDDSEECPCSLAPVIWYNLAISCQILGSELGTGTNDGTFYFMRSIYLYEKVLGICTSENRSHGLSTLFMAVLNNLAFIHYETGRFDQCSNLLQRLNCNLRSNGRLAVQRSWGIFVMNMLMMDTTRPRPAAAA